MKKTAKKVKTVKTVSHSCLTHTLETGYVASCRCGWEGEVRETHEQAYEEAGEHERKGL